MHERDGRTDGRTDTGRRKMTLTLTLHHTFTVSFQAQKSPFPQIFSTIVC